VTAVPDVTVVLPTRNRAPRLAAALEALRGQAIDAERFEIVIVDDGSSDATPDLLSRLPAGGEPGIRAIRLPGDGPAAARNAGWRAGRAQFVAFTDDDCEPTPTWLEAILRAAGESPGAIVQGSTRPIPRESQLLSRPFTRTRRIEAPSPWFATCNIAYPRALLERLDGFDELFPEALGEDTDLGWRALEAGARVEFAPGGVVHHAVEDLGAAGYMRHALRGADAVYAFRRHPGLRARTLRFGVFRNPSLARLALAIAGVLLARRSRVAALLVLPYARNLLGRALASDGGPLLVPYLLAYDLVQAYTSLRGSMKHRTLVL
jgi:glycosyltransferase involved in cell wall biosynthesis